MSDCGPEEIADAIVRAVGAAAPHLAAAGRELAAAARAFIDALTEPAAGTPDTARERVIVED